MTMRDLINFQRPFNVPVRQGSLGSTISSLQDEMNKLFEHFYNGTFARMADWDQKLPATPAVDVIENGKMFRVRIELAGMDPENVNLEVTDGYLVMKGEKKEETTEEGENYIRREISYGSFYRTIPLPETAETAKAEAKYNNGVLTVEIPKKADAVKAPKKLQIKKAA